MKTTLTQPSTPTDAYNLEYKFVEALQPYSNNPRTHSKAQVKQIAKSIQEFGFTNPILIDRDNGVIAGHGRLEAAKLLSLKEVPTLLLSELTEAQKRAYVIADNRLAEAAGWDTDILTIELQALVDLEFDVELTGFETPEIDILVGNTPSTDLCEADRIEEPDSSQPAITQSGDLWLLGRHRLFCGNALEASSYQAVLDNKKAHMIFTDPPYNVPINNHVCGNGAIKHREFAMASGEMSTEAFTDFLRNAASLMAAYSASGALHFICMDWRHMSKLLAAGNAVYSEFKNLCIWNKSNGGMGSLYRSKHQLVFVFKHGNAPHTNNIELGKHGRYRTNVWDYPGVNSFNSEARDNLALHPTVKPIALVADAILDYSKERGLILDPFGGSGSTLLAAEKTNRSAALVEIDPHYCDVIIKRYQSMTGVDAIHSDSGQTFCEHSESLKENMGAVI